MYIISGYTGISFLFHTIYYFSCTNAVARRAVYTRWGSRTCPFGAQKLYEGFIAGAYNSHNGSGANWLCMHPTPQYPVGASSGNQNGALLYGVEYENTGAVDKNHDRDAACVVCEHADAAQVYVQWGRKTCSNDHKTEYYGVIMSSHYSQRKNEFICVDWERAPHAENNNGNQNGGLLYTTEMEGKGSADEIAYFHDRELSCAVCSAKTFNTLTFTRWGAVKCPSGSQQLYEGFIASSAHNNNGAGANYLCMHPKPEWPEGVSTGNQNGALLYGTEYENTGAVDKNHDKDAGCAVCTRTNTMAVYVQWGRKTCSNGHRTEYTGLIMASHYTQQKSEFICVDLERAVHKTSSNANHNGALLYTTEAEQGSADNGYGHDRELSCAVCSAKAAVYSRWGSRSCPDGAKKLYEGFIGNGAHNHNGSGHNNLCLHPEPQWPDGMSTGNQNGALLYGTEYENTGSVDKNLDKDAGCVVCEHRGVGIPYVQWGRMKCTNDHNTEYTGVVMASHYSQKKSEFICVDTERAFHKTSSNSNHNGALLYTTEMEAGNAFKAYGHDMEVSCAVCAATQPIFCTAISNCGVPVTCTTKKNQQCSKCKIGYFIVNGAIDSCAKCPKGKFCDGTTAQQANAGGWDMAVE